MLPSNELGCSLEIGRKTKCVFDNTWDRNSQTMIDERGLKMYRCLETKLKFCLGVQWNLSFETPLFKGHLHSGTTKYGLGKCYTISVFVTSIEGTSLFREKGHFFLGPKTKRD